jgi:hypothetical protein
MRMHRLAVVALVGLAAVGMSACYDGNTAAKTVAPVILSESITEGPADVDISLPVDVIIKTMTITSKAKSPGVTLSQQDDVMLTDWVITCIRTDGGTVTSPQWQNFYSVYVPAGGTANVANYRIFPSDFFKQPPLIQLFPENGGFDKETGNRTIRQRLHIEIFGKTVGGRAISLPFDVNLNFFYQSP